ncbi:hypothetical protein [Emticicia sp. BO119]|uniref:hypothetical protein n=1 Tax=Emticicia sp. BO119 TaxID=2757768 RepID=UPI0015EFDCEE|nr:hypothetical protein [Emticicia sp. BO119]MBA4851263.1 hypothetical protein [Emticicia sp. BO119]
MKLIAYLFPKKVKPDWVNYPAELNELINSGQTDLTPWRLLDKELSVSISASLKKRYNRQLFPFAMRKNNDDVACFEKNCGDKVKIIHDFSSKGWENEGEFPNFNDWLAEVKNEMRDW